MYVSCFTFAQENKTECLSLIWVLLVYHLQPRAGMFQHCLLLLVRLLLLCRADAANSPPTSLAVKFAG
jgi:hypothetical protein